MYGGITCASIPAIKPIFSKHFRSVKQYYDSHYNRSSKNGSSSRGGREKSDGSKSTYKHRGGGEAGLNKASAGSWQDGNTTGSRGGEEYGAFAHDANHGTGSSTQLTPIDRVYYGRPSAAISSGAPRPAGNSGYIAGGADVNRRGSAESLRLPTQGVRKEVTVDVTSESGQRDAGSIV